MKQLILTILGASIANIITFIFYKGFVNSYFGRNSIEEVSRWFDQLSKHMRKLKK